MRTNLTILALLLAVLAGGSMLYKPPSMLEPESAQAGVDGVSPAAAHTIPPIDAVQPRAVQTATFALG